MEKEFLNIDDLSEYLGMKKSTIYSLVGNGDLPHYKIGRLIRLKREDVDTWIEGHRREKIDPEKKAEQWQKVRELAKCDEATLREIKTAADPLRHGDVLKITSSDRANLFMKTWDVVDGYLKNA